MTQDTQLWSDKVESGTAQGRFCQRACQVCAVDLYRKKVGAAYRKRVICIACRRRGWTYTPDGNLINTKGERDE